MLKKPIFKVLQNGKAVLWHDGIESIKVTDGIKDFVDTAEISLLNKDLPERGEKITIQLGYDDELWEMGSFVVAVITSGNEPKAKLKCHGVAFGESIKNKRNLPYSGLTVKQIVEEIAKRNGLKSECDIMHRHDYISQDKQSDLEFLNQLEKDHNALFNIKGDTIVLREKDKAKLSKDTLIRISANHCTYSITEASKGFYRSVEVSWQDTKKNAVEHVTHGAGNPVLKIQRHFDSIAEAKIYAQKQYKKQHADTLKGTITCQGLAIFAGYIVELSDAGRHDGEYLVEQVIHSLDKKYSCEITLQGIS